FALLLLVAMPLGAFAQSGPTTGMSGALRALNEYQRRERERADELAAREREHELQMRALDLQERQLEAGSASRSSSTSLMSTSEFRQAGLHKLTTFELAALNRWLLQRGIAGVAPTPPSGAPSTGNVVATEGRGILEVSSLG